MRLLPGEVAFLGQAFLKENAVDLRSAARDLGLPDWERFLDESAVTLELEYVRLFLNPLGAPCLPWQSAQAEEGRLMGGAHVSALDWFRRFGVEPAATHEPADHIGLLLLFYAHLLEIGAEPEAVAEFRSDHLQWVLPFCESLEQQTTLAFYRAICSRLRQIVGAEAADLCAGALDREQAAGRAPTISAGSSRKHS